MESASGQQPGRTSIAAFSRVAVVGRAGARRIVDSVEAVLAALHRAGVDSVVERVTARALGRSDGIDRAEIGNCADLVVVVGGDGSILGVARAVAPSGVPVLGVNRGGLGFLADVAPTQIDAKLAAVLRGENTVEERFLLAARVQRPGAKAPVWKSASGTAYGSDAVSLNDVVVHAGSSSRMMDMRLHIDGAFVYDQRSDGLIVSTPTGSTAYSLSAGGPIMSPKLDAVVIVPMFPHTLASRPLVVRGDSRIRITIAESAAEPRASCDSQISQPLAAGDEVHIGKHPHPLRLLFPLRHDFYESCRSKLDWATRLGRA